MLLVDSPFMTPEHLFRYEHHNDDIFLFVFVLHCFNTCLYLLFCFKAPIEEIRLSRLSRLYRVYIVYRVNILARHDTIYMGAPPIIDVTRPNI